MAWPLSQDYNEAIQSPETNFADPDLKRGAAVANALGLPMPYSGSFADVYEVRCPDGSQWAVKCFTRQAPGLRERYSEISKHLRQAKLPFTVDFTYLEQGIRVAGKWYPALKMQWVEGLTLNQFVGQYLDKPAMLEALLQMWSRMGQYLRAAKVAHCDLQHGNVLLVPGASANSLALKLIDYDGMWVPALATRKSGEVGHACYQHPQRLAEGTYSPEVDRFPLLLVATSLRALKARKDLWAKYDNGDNILFKEADLLAPLKSHLFLDLTKTGDPVVDQMMDLLVKALRGRLETVPLLEELLPDGRPAPATPAAPPVRPTPTAVRKAAPVARPAAAAGFVGAGALNFDDPAPELHRRKRAVKKSGVLTAVTWIVAIALGGVAGGVGVWAMLGSMNPAKLTTPDSRLAVKAAGTLTQDPKADPPASKDKDGGKDGALPPTKDAKPDSPPNKDQDAGTPAKDQKPDTPPIKDKDKPQAPKDQKLDSPPVKDKDKPQAPTDQKPDPPPIKDKDAPPPPKDQPGHTGNPPDVPPPNPTAPRPEDDIVNTIKMKLRLLKAGKFQMGSSGATDPNSEKPQHEVELTGPYYLGMYPVTKQQFAAFVSDEKYKTEAELGGDKETWLNPGFMQTDEDPVVCVSWNDAVKFCEWLSKKENKSYQLPTEAQWEYACRAGTTTAYFFSDDPKDLGDYAWAKDISDRRTHPVGGKKPNPWGLYDMNGNVYQWCADGYGPYPSGYAKDPANGNPKAGRVFRGGSWSKQSKDCRSASRRFYAPTSHDPDIGFRVSQEVPTKTASGSRQP